MQRGKNYIRGCVTVQFRLSGSLDALVSMLQKPFISLLTELSANSPVVYKGPYFYGKTTESDRHSNQTTNPNPNPYLVGVRYSLVIFAARSY